MNDALAHPYFRGNDTVNQILMMRAHASPDEIFCYHEGEAVTIGELNELVCFLSSKLEAAGLSRGARVATMMGNDLLHVVWLLALMRTAAVWVPVNTRLRGQSLDHVLVASRAATLVADVQHQGVLAHCLAGDVDAAVIWYDAGQAVDEQWLVPTRVNAHNAWTVPPTQIRTEPDAPICISFTSGTTGPPKGALLTDRGFRACAEGVHHAASAQPGDRLLLWEPIYHNGGNQVLIYGILSGVSLILVNGFHISSFWQTVDQYHPTHLHYIGGILQILLRAGGEERRSSSLKKFWGGGCPMNIWDEVRTSFNVEITEVYGMTETSSITSVNHGQRAGSVGQPLDYFDVTVVSPEGDILGANQRGEIVVRGRHEGLTMSGYDNDAAATREVMTDDGSIYTGDLGSFDDDGNLYFHGRLTQRIRRRGENVSPWEIESVVGEHHGILESAVIGVPAVIGEHDIALFVKWAPGEEANPSALREWCVSRLPDYQLPRYVHSVSAFEKTPTERIDKKGLGAMVCDAWDYELQESEGAESRDVPVSDGGLP